MKKSVITLSVLLGLACSQAMASTTELTITGTITPSACTPTLGNNGLVDYGRLSVESLEATNDSYSLPEKNLTFTVDCAASTLFALIGTDNRSASSADQNGFGLGLHGVTSIGHYALLFENAELDGQQANGLLSMDAGQTWQYWPRNVVLLPHGNARMPEPVLVSIPGQLPPTT